MRVDMIRMRIACPSCGAEYEVPDRLLAGAARTLRCSRCGTDFALPRAAAPAPAPPEPTPAPPMQAPPAAAPPPAASPPEAPPPPAPAVPERAPVASAATGGDAALRKAWMASVALVAAGVLALVVWRGAVMAAWPPATRLFAALGLA
jgi:predicted Zn finger-like uncharacterized protein